MTGRSKKRILWLVLLLAVIGGSYGLYQYNRGPIDVKNSKAMLLDAPALYGSFSKDSSGSLKTYANKILQVKGQVHSSSVNQQKQKVILLSTGVEGGYINCTMEDDGEAVAEGKEINIKGICSGMGQGEPDLGIMGDVYLTRCYTIKND